MRRHRRFYLPAAGLLLFTFGAAASLYGRSTRGDSWYLRTRAGNYYAVNALPGRLDFDWPERPAAERRWTFGHQVHNGSGIDLTPATVWNRLGFYGGFTGAGYLPDGGYVEFRELVVRPWPVCAACAALAAMAIWRWVRGRPVPGRCSACGYDLRGSPDRCPECGTRSADVS